MCVTVIKLISTFQNSAGETRLHLSDLPLLLIIIIFNNPTESDKAVRVACCRGGCHSPSFMRFTGSFSLHLSPQAFLLFLGWRLSSSAGSLLALGATAWQIKAAQSKRLPTALPPSGPASPSGGRSCAHTCGAAAQRVRGI